VEIEKNKFLRRPGVKGLPIFAAAMCFIAGTGYAIFDKLLQEHQWLLDDGSFIPYQNPWGFIRTWRMRIGFLIWYEMNIDLGRRIRKLKDLTQVKKGILPRRELAMRAYQIEYYQKHRNSLFDCLYLGEEEDFSEA